MIILQVYWQFDPYRLLVCGWLKPVRSPHMIEHLTHKKAVFEMEEGPMKERIRKWVSSTAGLLKTASGPGIAGGQWDLSISYQQ